MIEKLIAHIAAPLSLVCLVSACARATTSPPEAPACATLEPGRGLGRFTLGTKLKEASSVAPAARPGWFRPTAPDAAGTLLRFDADKVLVELESPLPACVALSNPTRTLEEPDPRRLAAAIGTCGPMQILEGGNRIDCEGLSIITGTLGPDGAIAPPILRFGPNDKAPQKPGCAVYFDKNARVDAGGVTAAKSVKIGEKEPVCVKGQDKPLTAATRPADVTHAGCNEVALRGGTHVKCGEQTYSFAGPTLSLDTVSIGAP